MALGGGTFVAQNKKLPGAYINFVSAARSNASLSDRGIVALPMPLDWGVEGEVITLTTEDFMYNSRKILGYDYSDPVLFGLREVFKNAQKVFLYRLGGGTKASNTFCEAKYAGKRGNNLTTVVTANVDEPEKFDVKTLLDLKVVDVQTGVKNTDELVDNDFVTWKKSVAVSLTASTPLTNGTTTSVQTQHWQDALSAFESYSFNTLGIVSTDEAIKGLAIAYTKRLRDEMGVKFQTVVYNKAANDKAIINVVSTTSTEVLRVGIGKTGYIKVGGSSADLVYWVTGAQAGCAVNASCTNKVYNGELSVDVKRTQAQLGECINKGEFVLHKVGDEVRVLMDINSKVDVTVEEGEDFKSNQTIRVIDQIGNDIAVLFNTYYLGKIPNDNGGRISLWNDIVKHHQGMQNIRAIENFVPEDVVVMKGEGNKDVVVSDYVTPVNALERLYMTCVIS